MEHNDVQTDSIELLGEKLNELSEFVGQHLLYIQTQLAQKTIRDDLIFTLANATAAAREAFEALGTTVDDAVDAVEAKTEQCADVQEAVLDAGIDKSAIEPEKSTQEMLDIEFALRTSERFMRVCGYYTIRQFRGYLAATEDFTAHEIDEIIKLHNRKKYSLREQVIESMQEAGEKVILLDRSVDRNGNEVAYGRAHRKEYAVGFIQGPESLLDTSDTTGQFEADVNKEVREMTLSTRFSITELAAAQFSVERMTNEQKQDARCVVEGLFAQTPLDSILSRDMKDLLVGVLNNRTIDVDAAKVILDRLYQAHLIGKKEVDDRLFYVCDPTQRRQRTKQTTSRDPSDTEKRSAQKQISLIDLGVEHVLDELVTGLMHWNQSLPPAKISAAIEKKGVIVTPEAIKAIARSLPDYLEAREGTQGGKSPHAKSRGQKIFTIRLKDQGVKDRWRENRKAILSEIEQIDQSKIS